MIELKKMIECIRFFRLLPDDLSKIIYMCVCVCVCAKEETVLIVQLWFQVASPF